MVASTKTLYTVYGDEVVFTISDVALPVDLLYFDTRENMGQVVLQWATASEIDNIDKEEAAIDRMI